MLFPIIRVIDRDDPEDTPRIVGCNSHDALVIDKKSGGIQYLNLQCLGGTEKGRGESTFYFVTKADEAEALYVEMVSFEELCEIYLEQTRQICGQEKALREFIKSVVGKHAGIVHDSGLDQCDGIHITGGNLF